MQHRPIVFISLSLCLLIILAGCKPGQKEVNEATMQRDALHIDHLLRKAEIQGDNNPDSAIRLAQEALDLSRQSGNSAGIARALLHIGARLFNSKQQFRQSKALFLEALPYCLRVADKDASLLPRLYNCLGNAYSKEGLYDSAFYFYYQSLNLLEEQQVRDTTLLLTLYSNIGGSYAQQGDGRQGIHYLQRAALLLAESGTTLKQADNYHNLGVAYETFNTDSAFYYYTKAAHLVQQMGDSARLQNEYLSMAVICLMQQNSQKAKLYLDTAIALDPAKALQDHRLQACMGTVSYHLGDLTKAIRYFERSLRLCRELGIRQDQVQPNLMLANIYEKTGNYYQAYHYSHSNGLLLDSLINENITGNLNPSEVKYRIAQKDKELIGKELFIANQINRIQRQYIGLIITGAVAIFVFLIFLLFLRKRQHMLHTTRLKGIIDGEEQERLRLSQELHDGIVSQLSAIKMNFATLPVRYHDMNQGIDDFRNVVSQLDLCISELRSTSHNLQPAILEQAGLIASLQLYCYRLSEPGILKITFICMDELSSSLPEAFQLGVYRIVQELLHNIVKHTKATDVLVQLNITDTELLITIEDNGVVISTEDDKLQGIGLYNLQKRIHLLKGNMEIESRENSTSLYLNFNITALKK